MTLSTLSLLTIESIIKVVTHTVQLFMWFIAMCLIALLITVFVQHNFKLTRVGCGTYVTDSNHSWLELNNAYGTRMLTITLSCDNGAIVNVETH